MDRLIFAGIIIGIFIGISFSPQIVDAIYSIPPTDSFRYIFVGSDPNDNVTARSYAGNTTFIQGAGVTITPNYATNEITFASGAGSAALEQLTNVTDTGCAVNQIIKVNSTGFWDCADISASSGNSTLLDDLGDVVITSPAYLSQLFFDGLQWIDKIFTINTTTCPANQFVVSIDNQTGIVTCSIEAGSGNVTVLNDLGDVIVSSPTYHSILGYNGTQFINKVFQSDSMTCGGTQKFSSYNNATGVYTCTDDDDGIPEAFFGNATVLTELGDVVISSPAYLNILQNNGTQFVNKIFTANTQSAVANTALTGFSNQTGLWTTQTFTLENLSNVTDTGCAVGEVLSVSGTSWVCTIPITTAITSINSDSAAAQVLSGTTSNVTITDTGAGTLQWNLGDAVVMIAGTAQTITKALTINSLLLGGKMNSQSNTIDAVGILNSSNSDTSDAGFIRMGNAEIVGWEASPASTDLTITSDASENLVLNSGWNNVDLGLNAMINSIFDVAGTGNRLTSTATALGDILKSDGTDFKRLARGSTNQFLMATATDISWQTPSAITGSGIPLPPKKWGELIPRSASTSLTGLTTGCTILATATFVYDVTDNSNAILSTTAITDGVNGGIHCVVTDFNSFTGAKNMYMYSKWEENKITTNRIFIGFSGAAATILPNNADTIVDSIDAAGLCIRTTDTVYQFCSNDGTGTGVYATLTTTEDTGVHFFEVYTTDAGVTWCGKLDGGTAVCSAVAADIPTTTDRLFATSTGETDGGATAILWTQYIWYIESGK